MTDYVYLAAGLGLLVVGGESLVRGAVSLARRLGISPLVIGLTLVGFGTSTPELVTSVQAALVGSSGIAVGNVVGSNIANILLILGIGALIAPMACTPAAFRRDGAVLALSAVALAAIALAGALGRPAGFLLLASLIGYTVVAYLSERRGPDADPAAVVHEREAETVGAGPRSPWLAVGLAVAGLVLTVAGARLLVDGAIGLARHAGISETIIGLTVVALGTSLPELVTSIMAAVRRQGDVAFGNIVGSNIYNVLGILGITALVQPLAVPPEILRLDLWVMLGVTALLIAFAVTGWRVSRAEGAVFLAGYVAYIGFLFVGAGGGA